MRADKQLIAGGQRSGQLVRGWEATLVLKSGEWRGGRRGRERCSESRRAPVEGDAVPYECGERKDYCCHLTANNKHPKISCPGEGLARSFLGLNTISTNKIPRFCPLRPLTPAPRPKDRPLILPQPYETLHVTDCRSHLCHITSLRLPIRCPKHAFHKPCPGLASASDIAPVKCICTC